MAENQNDIKQEEKEEEATLTYPDSLFISGGSSTGEQDLTFEDFLNSQASDLRRYLSSNSTTFFTNLLEYLKNNSAFINAELGYGNSTYSVDQKTNSVAAFTQGYIDAAETDGTLSEKFKSLIGSITSTPLEKHYWNESVQNLIAQLVQFYETLNGDAGNSFTATEGQPEKDYWVKRKHNSSKQQSYGTVRGVDRNEVVLNNNTNLQFTESKDADHLRLIMPEYLRKVEIEDLDRNFWVISNTLQKLSDILLDKDGLLKQMGDEIAQLWENVLFLWMLGAALMTKQEGDGQEYETHCEVVYLPNDIAETQFKYDNFEIKEDITGDEAKKAYIEKRLQYLVDSYPNNHLLVIPCIRIGNYYQNYYYKEYYYDVMFFNRNKKKWIYSNNTLNLGIDLYEDKIFYQEKTLNLKAEEGDTEVKRYFVENPLGTEKVKAYKLRSAIDNSTSFFPVNYYNAIRIVPKIIDKSSNKDEVKKTITFDFEDCFAKAEEDTDFLIANNFSFNYSISLEENEDGSLGNSILELSGDEPTLNTISKDDKESFTCNFKKGFYLGEVASYYILQELKDLSLSTPQVRLPNIVQPTNIILSKPNFTKFFQNYSENVLRQYADKQDSVQKLTLYRGYSFVNLYRETDITEIKSLPLKDKVGYYYLEKDEIKGAKQDYYGGQLQAFNIFTRGREGLDTKTLYEATKISDNNINDSVSLTKMNRNSWELWAGNNLVNCPVENEDGISYMLPSGKRDNYYVGAVLKIPGTDQTFVFPEYEATTFLPPIKGISYKNNTNRYVNSDSMYRKGQPLKCGILGLEGSNSKGRIQNVISFVTPYGIERDDKVVPTFKDWGLKVTQVVVAYFPLNLGFTGRGVIDNNKETGVPVPIVPIDFNGTEIKENNAPEVISMVQPVEQDKEGKVTPTTPFEITSSNTWAPETKMTSLNNDAYKETERGKTWLRPRKDEKGKQVHGKFFGLIQVTGDKVEEISIENEKDFLGAFNGVSVYQDYCPFIVPAKIVLDDQNDEKKEPQTISDGNKYVGTYSVWSAGVVTNVISHYFGTVDGVQVYERFEQNRLFLKEAQTEGHYDSLNWSDTFIKNYSKNGKVINTYFKGEKPLLQPIGGPRIQGDHDVWERLAKKLAGETADKGFDFETFPTNGHSRVQGSDGE